MPKIFTLIVTIGLLTAGSALAQTPATPPRNVDDILAVIAQYKPIPGEVERVRATAEANAPVTKNRSELTVFYHQRSRANAHLGRIQQEISDLKAALDAGGDANLPESLGDRRAIWGFLSLAEASWGNLIQAIEISKKTLEQASTQTVRVMHTWIRIARLYALLGDMESARKAMATAESYESTLRMSRYYADYENNIRKGIDRARAWMLSARGNSGEAERLYRSSLAQHELDLQANASRIRWGRVDSFPTSSILRGWAETEQELAIALRDQGRLSEAETYSRSALLKCLQSFGRYSPITAGAIVNLADVVLENGRFSDAATLAMAAIDTYEQSGVAAESLPLAQARATLGAALVGENKWEDAIKVFAVRDRGLASDPGQYARFSGQDTNFGIALLHSGEPEKALPMLERLYRDRIRNGFSVGEYFTAQNRGFYAMALAATGDTDKALVEFIAAVPVLVEQSGATASSEQGAVARQLRLTWILEAYMQLLSEHRDSPLLRARGIDPVTETFRIADVARGSGVQRALAASAARATPSDPALAELARREQDTRQRVGALSDLLSRLLSSPPEQQLPKIISELRRDIDALRGTLVTLKQELAQRFPDYVQLIDPKPVTLAQVQAGLTEGEALLSLYVGSDRTYVWAIPKTGTPAFASVDLKEADVAAKVADLRKALDSGDVTIDAFPRFDTALAHTLYAQLLAPVEAGWRDARSLIVIPHKALGQLPFALLPTGPATGASDAGMPFEEYRQVPWLIRRAAVTQLPAASTLLALRRAPAVRGMRKEFAGFGDPLFSREMAQAGDSTSTARSFRLRNLSIAKVAGTSIAIPVADAPKAPTANVANSSSLAQLSRLPDTADEIRGMARVLGAGSGDVFLGRAASEKNAKSGLLADRRIIAFATHGLVQGDLNGLTQPALALSSPEVTGNADEDGLLTMEEVLSLKLNADWVVLSACNTASGNGEGSEAVSGLGRAFFYAGARSLLVSNWPVETVSARLLTTRLFELQAANSGMTRAEALRRTMLEMIDQEVAVPASGKAPDYSYAHPLFWAPFSLVGDGGR